MCVSNSVSQQRRSRDAANGGEAARTSVKSSRAKPAKESGFRRVMTAASWRNGSAPSRRSKDRSTPNRLSQHSSEQPPKHRGPRTLANLPRGGAPVSARAFLRQARAAGSPHALAGPVDGAVHDLQLGPEPAPAPRLGSGADESRPVGDAAGGGPRGPGVEGHAVQAAV